MWALLLYSILNASPPSLSSSVIHGFPSEAACVQAGRRHAARINRTFLALEVFTFDCIKIRDEVTQ